MMMNWRNRFNSFLTFFPQREHKFSIYSKHQKKQRKSRRKFIMENWNKNDMNPIDNNNNEDKESKKKK